MGAASTLQVLSNPASRMVTGVQVCLHAHCVCCTVRGAACIQRQESVSAAAMTSFTCAPRCCWWCLCVCVFHQVTGLIEPVQLLQLQQLASSDASSSNNSSSIAQQQAHMVLVLHQLSWLFSAMQSLLQLCSMLDAPMATGLKQGAFSLSVEVLKAVAPANPAAAAAPGAGAGAVAAAQFACTRSVLRLLAIPGQLAPPEAQVQELLVLLQGLADTHAGLHAVLAGVLGTLGVAANTDATFQVCVWTQSWQSIVDRRHASCRLPVAARCDMCTSLQPQRHAGVWCAAPPVP